MVSHHQRLVVDFLCNELHAHVFERLRKHGVTVKTNCWLWAAQKLKALTIPFYLIENGYVHSWRLQMPQHNRVGQWDPWCQPLDQECRNILLLLRFSEEGLGAH